MQTLTRFSVHWKREHTLVELARMEKVRRFLINNDIADKDSFMDFLNEIL